MKFPIGHSPAPSITFQNDFNTGIFVGSTLPEADNFKIIKALEKGTITETQAKKILKGKGFLNEKGQFRKEDYITIGTSGSVGMSVLTPNKILNVPQPKKPKQIEI